ncbi:MAG TPA: ABC transporter substrate-binding protein [Planctomycetota bacterium]|jgi:branched-chain amino acid transport system substrate-binding protein
MLRKASAFVLVFAVSICALSNPSCAAQEKEPIKIGAIFAVTGGASFLGGPEAKTSEMMIEDINAKGGVLGRPLQLVIKNSEGSPEKAVAFAKQLIEEDKVVAIIGPSTSGESLQIKGLCQKAEIPLVSCAAAELIVNPIASFVFKTPQNDSFAAEKICAKIKASKLTKVGIVSANDGFGKAGRAQLQKLAPNAGLQIVADEVYEKDATDLTAVITKLKAAGAEVVVNWSVVPAQSIIAKNMKQLAFNAPLYQSHGFGNIKYVEAAGAAAEGICFPCGRLLIAEALPENHPQRSLLVSYKQSYEKRFGEAVSTFGGHAYDAILLVTAGLKKAGAADRAKLRDALEMLQGVIGTAGTFNLSATDHNGLTIDAFDMLTVKDGKFVPCEK